MPCPTDVGFRQIQLYLEYIMPKEFRKFLDRINDQLFFNSDRIVVLDEDVLEKEGLSRLHIKQGVAKLKELNLIIQENLWEDWKESDIPTTHEDRHFMLETTDGSYVREAPGFRPELTKYQVVLLIDKKFDEFYKNLHGELASQIPSGNVKVIFLQEESSLKIGNQIVKLPPFRNEFEFCRVMFSYRLNEPVDWEVIYKDIERADPKDQVRAKRKIYDTYLAVNKRVCEQTKLENLFIWKDRTVRRQF